MRLVPRNVRTFNDTGSVVPLAWYRNDTLMAGAPKGNLKGSPNGTSDKLTVPMNVSFAVECALVSMVRPERHRLSYRLEGFEEAWSLAPTSSTRLIRYTAMPPGVYRLLIRSRIHEDVLDENVSNENALAEDTLVITILVPTPWYCLWWVQAVAALLVASARAAGIRARERRRAEQRSTQRFAEEQKARERGT